MSWNARCGFVGSRGEHGQRRLTPSYRARSGSHISEPALHVLHRKIELALGAGEIVQPPFVIQPCLQGQCGFDSQMRKGFAWMNCTAVFDAALSSDTARVI
jgi:hypothetical protein